MTVDCIDQNYLRANRFKIQIPLAPKLAIFAQDVTFPGIQVGDAMHPTALFDLGQIGEKLTFDTLDVNFIVQENFENYEELYTWFLKMADPSNFEPNRVSDEEYFAKLKCDITLFMFDNANILTRKVVFTDAFPMVLSPLAFTTKEEAPITTNVIFKFSVMKIMPIGEG